MCLFWCEFQNKHNQTGEGTLPGDTAKEAETKILFAEALMKKYMTVTVQDGSKWAVPVEIIARNRATYYANEFEGDIEKSLAEDTIPLFEMDEYEIQNWAVWNMTWSDFDGHQVKV